MGKFKLSALMLALVAANSAIAATEEERTSAKEIDPELEVIEEIDKPEPIEDMLQDQPEIQE